MNSTVTIRDYLETIRNVELDIFDAISIKNDGDEALRYRMIFGALASMRDAREGIEAIEGNRHLSAFVGGLRGGHGRDRDARGRFISRADAAQERQDRWASDRELEREARQLGLI